MGRKPHDTIAAPSRRDVLKWGGAVAATLLAWPRRGFAFGRSRELSLYNVHTDERLTAEYVQNGVYQPDALASINQLLRDHYNDEVYPIDPGVLDILAQLHDDVDAGAPFHVLSGYRSPATNAWRRQISTGVAEHSFHLTGQAIDLFVPGRDLARLRGAALALGGGGVGYYPSAGFVHVDSGPVRTWGGGTGSRRHARSHGRSRAAGHHRRLMRRA